MVAGIGGTYAVHEAEAAGPYCRNTRRRSPHSTPTKQPHAPNRRGGVAQLAAQQHALGPHDLETAKEGCSPGAHREDSSKQNDGVDVETTGAGPVSVRFQIEPESKFIERKGSADTITHRHQAAEKNGHGRVRAAQIEQPSIANQKQDEYAPDKMMDVSAAHHDPLKWPVLMNDQADQKPHPMNVIRKETDAINMRRRGRSGIVERMRKPRRVN